jgi:hypothetical protein
MENGVSQPVIIIFRENERATVDYARSGDEAVRMDNTETAGELSITIDDRYRVNLTFLQFLFEQCIEIKGDDTPHVSAAFLNQIRNRL